MGAGGLSRILRISEKEVIAHLSYVSRTVSRNGQTLAVLPFRCLSCGFVFKNRKRYTRPGRCPKCKKTHIETPIYGILEKRGGSV